MTFESDYDAVLCVKARRDRLDVLIEQMAADCEFTPVLRRLGCLRGIDSDWFALAVEVGDLDRFTGKTIGSFIGLVPSSTPGASRVQGSITKTGNSHLRRLLVEAAWHHRPAYRVGKTMRDRWELAGPAARARGDQGNRRLHHRWNTMRAGHKRHTVATVAIARELAGWCWSLAVLEIARPPQSASSTRTVAAARGATRDSAMSNPAIGRRSTRDTRSAPAEQPVLR